MTRLRRAIPLIALIASAGCRMGGNWDPEVVNSPLGATVEFRNESGTHEAELLLVRDDGLIILIDREVRLSRWTDMTRVRFPGMPVYVLASRQRPGATAEESIRKVSRYPRGLSDDQLAELLSSFGQTGIAVQR